MSAAERRDSHDRPAPPRPPVEPPWTEAQLAQISGFVTAGLTLPDACEAAGIRWTTARHWSAKGNKGVMPYAVFADAVRRAKAMHKAACRVSVSKHMATDWRAAAWAWEKLEAAEHRAQLARDQAAARGQLLGRDATEATVIMYPVPVPEGADLDTLPRLPPPADDASDDAHAINHPASAPLDGDEETDDDDDWPDDDE